MEPYGAENSLKEIYHSWFYDGSQWDNADITLYGPAPGYLAGGANQTYNANTNLSPPYNQPPQKSYLDFNTSSPDNSWEISEPAIYYQAAYIRLLANVANLNENDTLSDNEASALETTIRLAPNPVKANFKIEIDNYQTINIIMTNLNGQQVLKLNNFDIDNTIDISELQAGIYVVSVEVHGHKTHLKLIKR